MKTGMNVKVLVGRSWKSGLIHAVESDTSVLVVLDATGMLIVVNPYEVEVEVAS